MAITINVNGIETAIESLAGMSAKASDLTPAFKVSRLLILESVSRNFMQGGRPKWKELSPATVERRMRSTTGYQTLKRGRDKGRITAATARNIGAAGFQVLRDKGMLMNSLGISRSGGIAGSPDIDEISKTTMVLGTNIPYARYHQYGQGVPERPFLILQPIDEERIEQVIAEHIAKEEK